MVVCNITKHHIAAYVETAVRNRLEKAKLTREKLAPPGYKSLSSYVAYLLKEGLQVEEKKLRKLRAQVEEPNE